MDSEMVELLTRTMGIKQNIEQIITDLSDWSILKEVNKGPEYYQGKLYYRDGEDGKVQIVSEIMMPWSMAEIAALSYEVDLFPKYLKTSDRQKVHLTANPVPLVIDFTNYISFPWPLDDRWTDIKSVTYIDSESICFSSYSHSKGDKEFFGEKLPKKPSGAERFVVNNTARLFKKSGD
jgi:hypothetical protein